MTKFKIAVSKNQKKYTLVFTAENELIARDRVHTEGYSILNIEEISDDLILGTKFIFEGTLKGESIKGKVVGEDIFKIYVKLRKDLGYIVKYLYPEDKISESTEYKSKLINELEEEYDIFTHNKKNKNEDNKLHKKNKIIQSKNVNLDNFYLKKELDQTYKFIEFILSKLKYLINGKDTNPIDLEQREKLKNIYNSIIKLKKTTNISKLKEIGELALIKIGSIELHELEKNKSIDSKVLLKETNKLLKLIGSSEQFIEKNKDIKYILKKMLLTTYTLVIGLFDVKSYIKEKKNIDKTSHSFIRTERLLKKYKEKLHINSINLIKHIYIFIPFLFQNKKNDLLLRRSVIMQNITLFEAKKKGVGFSYTSIVNGYEKFNKSIQSANDIVRMYLFYVVIIYSIFFIIYLNIGTFYPYLSFNYKGFLYFIIILLSYVIFHFRLGLINIILNFAFLFFIIIFLLVNF